RVPLDMGNYPYVCARVKAKKALLYPAEMYQKFLNMTVAQISRTLGEGEYREEILALGAKYSGADLVEFATRDNMARVYTQVLDFSEGDLKNIVSKFIDRWDVWNIQTILRGKFYGASPSEIMDEIIPAGTCTAEFLRMLAGKDTLDEVIESLDGTPYYEPLINARKDGEDGKTIAPLEDSLYKRYYSLLLETVHPTNEPNAHFLRFIRMEIDMLNLRTLLRLKISGEKGEGFLFLDGGLELNAHDLPSMLGLEWEPLISRLKRCSFYKSIAGELAKARERGLNDLMIALERHVLREATRHANLHPLSVLPVLDFMVAKKNEVDNIRIIARGRESGLDNDLIRGLLIHR
ncbi:MAG: ATP synthase A1 subunit C, partial [Candidatus Thermoplasmatota archaeon]